MAAAASTTPRFPPVQAARDKRERDKANRVRVLNLIPRDAAPFTKANLRQLAEADKQAAIRLSYELRLAASKVNGSTIRVTREERDAAAVATRKAETAYNDLKRDLDARTDQRYAARVTSETKALEEARGEIVKRALVHTAAWLHDEQGRLVLGPGGLPILHWGECEPLRVETRDALEILVNQKVDIARGIYPISHLHYAAGVRLQHLYEKVDPKHALKPPPYDASRFSGIRGGGPHHGGEGWEDKLREISDTLASVILAVRLEGERTGGANRGALWIRVLYEVVCEGTPIARAVSGSRARKRWRKAVEPVLDVVADKLGMS
jgi:hypothetical protein